MDKETEADSHCMGGTNTEGGGDTGDPGTLAFTPAPWVAPSFLSAQELGSSTGSAVSVLCDLEGSTNPLWASGSP